MGEVDVPRQAKTSNLIKRCCQEFHRTFQKSGGFETTCVEIPHRNIPGLATQTTTMPGPSNTLLIEGSFGELAEELAQYLDPLLKSEPGAGLEAEIEPALKEIREKEQAEEPAKDSTAVTNDVTSNWKLGVQLWTFMKFPFVTAIAKTDSAGVKYVEAFPGQALGGGMKGSFDIKMPDSTRAKIKQLLQKRFFKYIQNR